MPTYRFPIFICQAADGSHTATLVESPDLAPTVAATAAVAVEQVKSYLVWKYQRAPWSPEPDLLDAELDQMKVEVRPEYEHEGRRYPVADSIELPVWLVKAKDRNDMFVCSLPTLGIMFSYSDAASLRSLVSYYVQNRLRGLTPRDIAALLPPPSAGLEDVAIRVDTDREVRFEEEPPRQLSATADAVGEKGFARRLSRPWERDDELDRLVKLLRTEPVSVLLVGEAGCGKTSLLVEAARRIEREGASPDADADTPANRRRFWVTNAGRLIAGMKYLGEWEERLEEIIGEVAGIDGWLCIESLLDLVNTGGANPQDSLASFLSPYIARREIRVIIEATPADLDSCRRLLPGFAELLRIVRVPPMTRAQAIGALSHVARAHGTNRKIEVLGGVVELVHRLHGRFLPYQAFPGAASGFIAGLVDHAAREGKKQIGPSDAVARFVRTTGLPELFVRDELPLHLDEVIATFRRRVIAQAEACQEAAGVITTFKAGMNDPHRPIGVLLFCGPTGVGKTELARAIADYLFGHGEDAAVAAAGAPGGKADRMIRLDMSEYAGFGAADRLMTDADGGPSELVRRVRQQPFNLILLDEVEKAAPEVFDVLLGLFDEGRLTDRGGRLTIFRSCLVVMTSNLGSETAEPFGLNKTTSSSDALLAAVGEFFRPEFLNRVDAVIPFRPLDADTVRLITEKELTELSRREGLTKANLTLAWTPAVVETLASSGFDKRYGARPLQRTIEQSVVTPLAAFLVAHPKLRNATVRLEIDEDGAVTVAM